MMKLNISERFQIKEVNKMNKVIINIVKLVIILISLVVGRSYYKKIGKSLEEEDKRIDEAEKKLLASEDSDFQNLRREEVRSTVKRLDNLKKLIEDDPRFEEDDFNDNNIDYVGTIKLIEKQVVIEIPTYSDSVNNDLNCVNLYTDLTKSECEDLNLFIKTYVYNKSGEEINLKQGDYRSFSDLPKEFKKVIVVKVNRGCDDSIVELLYNLTHGYDQLDGDGSYVINGRNQMVTLQAFSPLQFIV